MPLRASRCAIFDFLRLFAFLDPRTPSEGSKPPKTGQKGRFWPRFRLFFGACQGTHLPTVRTDAILQNRRNTPATFFVPLDPASIFRPWATSNFSSGPRYGHFSVGETAVLARFWPFWGPKRRFRAFWPILAPETVIFRVFDVFGPVFGPRRVPASAAGSGRIVRDARAARAASARALRSQTAKMAQ